MNKILTIGTCTKDIFEGKSYFGGAAGGITLNLAKLDVSVGILSVLGDDSFSKKYLKELKKRKTDIKLLAFKKGALPILEVVSKRNSETARKFNDNGTYQILENLTHSKDDFKSYAWIHAVNVPKKLADYTATHFKGKVSYCPGSLLARNPKSLSVILIKKADLIFANEEEFIILNNMVNFKELFERNLKALILTRGSKGNTLITKNGRNSFQPKKVKVIDSTGAGDALVVGFIKEYILGKKLEDSMEEGMRIATKSVMTKGVIL
jgi:sugar/nucleoside kinase (ribokinase family)